MMPAPLIHPWGFCWVGSGTTLETIPNHPEGCWPLGIYLPKNQRLDPPTKKGVNDSIWASGSFGSPVPTRFWGPMILRAILSVYHLSSFYINEHWISKKLVIFFCSPQPNITVNKKHLCNKKHRKVNSSRNPHLKPHPAGNRWVKSWGGTVDEGNPASASWGW